MSGHEYTWEPPKLRVGDRSEFIDHNGALRTGECMRVETHYTAATGRHYHIYAMRPDDRMNWKWVGEENICLAKESS